MTSENENEIDLHEVYHRLSRLQIEEFIHNVLTVKEDKDEKPQYVADCYCHLDVLFEK
jgi:hypothetical protein